MKKCNIMGVMKNPLFLAISSATVHNEVALFNADKIIFKKTWLANRDEAEKILRNIEIVMREGKKRFSDLAAIFTVTGPGGFTGLRIGIAIVNALAWNQKIPIYYCDAFVYSRQKIPGIIKVCKKNKLVRPIYLRKPHITQSKKQNM